MNESSKPGYSLSVSFVDALYRDYLVDPGAVPADWRAYFATLPVHGSADTVQTRRSIFNPTGGGTDSPPEPALLALRVARLVDSFRALGHREAHLSVLDGPGPEVDELHPRFHGISDGDLGTAIQVPGFREGASFTVAEIIDRLKRVYCGRSGVEFMHIEDVTVRRWLQARLEKDREELPREQRLRILNRLVQASMFEEFIRKKFIGAKSFSIEGAETLIPMVDWAIENSGDVEDIVIGMAHRGRLNVLANILGKPPRHIFREFADLDADLYIGRGDVKYHLGHSTDWTRADGREVHLSLCFNPSHLEFVNPVVLGRVRAKQDLMHDRERTRALAILVHGDASFAGEGVIQESLNLSELAAYATGGALHIVVNNQIGFTTLPSEARSTRYCTDVAKMLQVPIFHVNGEDPEAAVRVIELAMEFRRTFRSDVFVDLIGFRRHGHNETDEPAFTQPLMYERVRTLSSVRDIYQSRLVEAEVLVPEDGHRLMALQTDRLESELALSKATDYVPESGEPQGQWTGYSGGYETEVPEVPTGVDRQRLLDLLAGSMKVPQGFQLHPKIEAGFRHREETLQGARPVDWAAAETLAFASLVAEGHRVRLTGQDSQRGTFSHRHAVLHDPRTGQEFRPLEQLAPGQAPIEIHNSPLTETGVLGFEYGYSLDFPDALVAWEAQFGDFWNTAQVIVDQFVVAGEDKWTRMSGITLLLPHGFEGMGPEHSSARLERWLALSAEDNIQVVNPTTPAQLFHCLRRQVLRPWRKPLVVMTPKSLLRHSRCVSTLEDLEQGRFQRILPDAGGRHGSAVKRVLLCSGKIYFDLDQERERLKRDDVAIVRVEQLYPLRETALEQHLGIYGKNTPVFWVQEEPENMGAWPYMRMRFGHELVGRPFSGITRRASASPASGSPNAHRKEQAEILSKSFGDITKGAVRHAG